MSDTSNPFDIVIIGSIGIDTNIYLQGIDIDFSVEANFTTNLDYIGQAGGYACRCAARLGYRTAFIGSVGVDFWGDYIHSEFQKEGIDMTAVFVDPQGTNRSVNFMYQDGRRKNFYDGKGHMSIQPDYPRCREILARSSHAHFNLMNWSRNLLPIAKNLGLTISCDLQDVVSLQDSYRDDFIRQADILFFSNVNFPDPTPVITHYRRQNPTALIIVGMGYRGCAVSTPTQLQYFHAVDLPNWPVIDTNGAGDGLAIGFLTSYLFEKRNLRDAILRGQITARYKCGIKASSSDLITKRQLDQYAITLRSP